MAPPATRAKRPRNNGNNRTARIYRAQNSLINALNEQLRARELHQLAHAAGNNHFLRQHTINYYKAKKTEANRKIRQAIQALKNAMSSKN
jgi:hypothetical protein